MELPPLWGLETVSSHRQPKPTRRLLAAAALALLVVVGCQAPADTTNGETGRTMITIGANA